MAYRDRYEYCYNYNRMFLIDKKKLFISAVIPLIPILNLYRLSIIPVGLGEITLAVVMVVLLTANKGHIKGTGKYYFVLYYTFFLLLALLSILVRNQNEVVDFIQKWIRLVIYICIFDVMAKTEFDFDTMCKWCIRFGIIVSVFLIIQILIEAILHIQITPYLNIKWFPLNYGGEDTIALIQKQRRWFALGIWRASSIFPEPASFAQFVLLPLTLVIFWKGDFLHRKKRIICAIILTSAVLLSKSANGILIMLIVWGVYIVGSFRGKIKRSRFICIAALMVIVVIVISQTNYLSEAWDRVETFSVGGGSTTANQRLLQGFAIFGQLPTAAKWLGIGFGNVEAFLVENHITTTYLSDIGNEYMNGLSTVLVSGGIIGFIWFLIIWFRLFFENKSSVSRVLFMVISILFCTSAMFYSVLTVVYLVFIRCRKGTDDGKSVKGNESLYTYGRNRR